MVPLGAASWEYAEDVNRVDLVNRLEELRNTKLNNIYVTTRHDLH